MIQLGYRYYRGFRGVGMYSVKADPKRGYLVRYYRPSGKGARGRRPKEYVLVERLSTQRKSKSLAMDRAFAMAHGGSRRAKLMESPKPPADNPSMTAYCLKEKKHVRVSDWDQTTTRNGRSILVAYCPNCATKVSKLGRLIDCPECGESKPVAKDDYICKDCRANAN